MKIHMVKKGDTLYFIGQKYKVSVEEILAMNPGITNPDVLEVGMKIKIPSSHGGQHGVNGMDIMHQHVVKQGDTLWKLSKAWGVPLATMIHANPHLKNPNVLLTGEIVNIPKADAQVPATFAAQSVPAKTPTHPLSPSSLMQGVQGVVGKLSTAPSVIGKTFTGFATEKTPTAPIVSPVPPAPAPKPPAAKVEPAKKVEPLAEKVEPLAAKTEPVASKVEPLASKVEPLASKVEPLASKVEPLASKMEPVASKVEPLSTGKTLPDTSNIAPLSTGKTLPASKGHVSPLATGDISPNSSNVSPLATGDISPISANVSPLATGKTLPASEANVSPLATGKTLPASYANVSPLTTGNVSPLSSNVSPLTSGNVSPLSSNVSPMSIGNMAPMSENVSPFANTAPATKVAPYAKKALPIEKPFETKVTPMQSNYMESVDLFQQYHVPATEVMAMQDSPNSYMPYQVEAASKLGPLSDTPPMYPYDCPPGMYPVGGYPSQGLMPYSAGSGWGYGHSLAPLSGGMKTGMVSPLSANPNAGMVSPLSANPNAGMVSPLSANPNAGMVSPLSANPNAGMVSPLSANPNAGMVSPLSANPNAGMVSPLSANPNAGMVSPLSANPNAGMVSPLSANPNAGMVSPLSANPNAGMVSPLSSNFHEYSAMYPPPGYSGYISGYPTGYPYPVWPNQQAPVAGVSQGNDDCGCGGKREDELTGNKSVTKTSIAKPRKKAKKAVIRTVAPSPKKKSSGGSRPWLNR